MSSESKWAVGLFIVIFGFLGVMCSDGRSISETSFVEEFKNQAIRKPNYKKVPVTIDSIETESSAFLILAYTDNYVYVKEVPNVKFYVKNLNTKIHTEGSSFMLNYVTVKGQNCIISIEKVGQEKTFTHYRKQTLETKNSKISEVCSLVPEELLK